MNSWGGLGNAREETRKVDDRKVSMIGAEGTLGAAEISRMREWTGEGEGEGEGEKLPEFRDDVMLGALLCALQSLVCICSGREVSSR